MKVELNKRDLINLVNRTGPSYSQINEFTEKGYGYFIGGMSEKWYWNDTKLYELTEEELFALYQELKYKG